MRRSEKAEELDRLLGDLETGVRSEDRIWPRTLSDMVDVLADHMTDRKGLAEDLAMREAQDVIMVIAHYLGGRQIYLPRTDRLRLALRDAVIYRCFDGANHRELAERHGLTPARIYSIIAGQRKLRSRQGCPSA